MVAQYSQWDGYLEGQGSNILRFLLVPGNIERLKRGLNFITVVDDATVKKLIGRHTSWTFKNQKKVCRCGAVMPWSGPTNCYPSTLDRDTGAKVFDIIAAAKVDDYVPIQMSLDFAQDSLFCEYCYCVDLDAEVFEVFGGHVKNPKKEGVEQIGEHRFAEVCKNADAIPKLLKSFPLAKLPKNLKSFLRQVAKSDEESEFEDEDEDDGEGFDEEDDDDVDDADETDKSEVGDEAKETVADDEKTGVDDKAVDAGDDKKGAAHDSVHDSVQDIDREIELEKEVERMTMTEIAREIERETEREVEKMTLEEIGKELENEKERNTVQETGNGDKKDRSFILSFRKKK